MSSTKVSIIVNNFNYAHYLRRSVESALAQTHTLTEVVVVDDASTDGSQDLIRSFGERVVPVLQKKNRGQGAAFHAGFQASSGDIVIFLDADDHLYPHAAERVAAAFEPGVVKVQYRLHLADNEGRILDLYPSAEVSFDSGDVVPLLLQKGRYEAPVTSGNAFSRRVLKEILPMPEEDFRISADGYLVTVAPLFGEVVSIDGPLGVYVQHGNNAWAASGALNGNLAHRFRRSLEHDAKRLQAFEEWATRLGLSISDEPGLHDPLHLSSRLASLCLDPQGHPNKDDSRFGLGLRGSLTTLTARLSWRNKAMNALWFLTAGVAPEPVAQKLVAWKLVHASRPAGVDRLLKQVRRLALGGGFKPSAELTG